MSEVLLAVLPRFHHRRRGTWLGFISPNTYVVNTCMVWFTFRWLTSSPGEPVPQFLPLTGKGASIRSEETYTVPSALMAAAI